MRIWLYAATAALGLGTIGSAYAGDGDGTIANSRFTEIPGVVAEAPVRNAPQSATAPDGQALRPDVSRRTTWVFPPIGKYLTQ